MAAAFRRLICHSGTCLDRLLYLWRFYCCSFQIRVSDRGGERSRAKLAIEWWRCASDGVQIKNNTYTPLVPNLAQTTLLTLGPIGHLQSDEVCRSRPKCSEDSLPVRRLVYISLSSMRRKSSLLYIRFFCVLFVTFFHSGAVFHFAEAAMFMA